MTEQTIRDVVWAAVFVFIIQAVLIYSLTRLLVTGRTLFQRKPDAEPEHSWMIHRG